jgi:hypothetical protein
MVNERLVKHQFLLPVSYWPERSAVYWWHDFRSDEVVREFNLASAAGATLLQLTLPWDVSQPYSERVSLGLMRDLESVLRIAADSGVRCLLSIAVASVFDVLTLPHWFYELTADERARPVRVMRRLYEDPLVVNATARLVSEVTGEFGAHPSVEGWIIGDGLASASPPRSAEHISEWLERMHSSARLHGRSEWHGVSARDIARLSALQLRELSRNGFGVFLHIDWKPRWAHDTQLWVTFLVTFVRSLGGLPPIIDGSTHYPMFTPNASEEMVELTIQETRAAGAAGLVWPALLDYDRHLSSRAPFVAAPGELARGLLSTTRGMSPAAVAWLDAASHPGTIAPPQIPLLDEEVRSRDPEGFMRTAYGDFIS